MRASDTMPMKRSPYLWRSLLGGTQPQTILALLLWSGVTVFIFGILIDFFR